MYPFPLLPFELNGTFLVHQNQGNVAGRLAGTLPFEIQVVQKIVRRFILFLNISIISIIFLYYMKIINMPNKEEIRNSHIFSEL